MKIKRKNEFICAVNCFSNRYLTLRNGSEPYREAVLQLGGRVVNHLSERLTHYICSNPDPKRLIAAKMLRLFVVSPLWIEQSRELGKRAPEKDFTVTSQLVEDIRIAVRSSALRLPQSEHIREPIPNRAASTRSIDSPFFSSSQRDPSTSCSHPIPAPVPAPVPAGTLSMPSKADHTEDQPFARPVPIPLFREYKPPEIKDTSKFARRRSDRLCDLDESDEDDSNDEEFAKEAGENNDSLTLPSLQQVMTIPRNRRLPVIYVNESSEEALSKFKKSLYEESLSDKERRRIRAQTTKKNQKDAKKFANPPQALKNNDYPKSSSRDKAAPSSTGSAKKEIDKVEMNRLTNKIREYGKYFHHLNIIKLSSNLLVLFRSIDSPNR